MVFRLVLAVEVCKDKVLNGNRKLIDKNSLLRHFDPYFTPSSDTTFVYNRWVVLSVHVEDRLDF